MLLRHVRFSQLARYVIVTDSKRELRPFPHKNGGYRVGEGGLLTRPPPCDGQRGKGSLMRKQMTGPVPDRLTLANAARELLREAEAEGARNKAKLEEYMAEIRQLMGTL